MARVHNSLGYAFQESQKSKKEAEAHFRKALQIAEELNASPPYSNASLEVLANSANNVGAVISDSDTPNAKAYFLRAVQAYEQLMRDLSKQHSPANDAQQFDYKYRLGIAYYNLGGIASKQHQDDEAVRYLESAADLHSQLANAFPDVIEYRTKLTYDSRDLANAHACLLGDQESVAARDHAAKAAAAWVSALEQRGVAMELDRDPKDTRERAENQVNVAREFIEFLNRSRVKLLLTPDKRKEAQRALEKSAERLTSLRLREAQAGTLSEELLATIQDTITAVQQFDR